MIKKITKQRAMFLSALMHDMGDIINNPDLICDLLEMFSADLEDDEMSILCKSSNSLVDDECRNSGKHDVDEYKISRAKLSLKAVQNASSLSKHLFAYALIDHLLDSYPDDYVDEVLAECRLNRPH